MPDYLLDCNHLSTSLRGFRRCPSGSTKDEGPGIVSFLVTWFSAGWKLEFNRPRIQTTIVAGWPNSCAMCGYGPWMPRPPRLYGAVYLELRRRGRVLSQVDIMLAALARQHMPIVLTTDRDFEALSDLAVENWAV